MRWSSLFTSLTLLAAGASAAKQSATDRFDEFHAKSLKASPFKLDDASYKKLTAAPRDYTVGVLLTAMDARFGCQLCREFQPEWDLLGRTWTKGDKPGESRMLFGTLDFSDGRETFMSLGLQTAPVLLLFQPTSGPHAVSNAEPLRYDFTNGPQIAEQVHAWIARHLPERPHPPIKRPINWMRWIVSLTIISGGSTFAVVAWPYIQPIAQNRNLWAFATVIGILVFTSGHMFNQIRKVPYVAGDGRGGISYFAGGFQNQYGLESQIVGAMYGVLALASIALIMKVPRIADPKSQQVAVIVWGGILFVMYSFLLSIFRIKNGGYPFSLPPFM